MLIAKDGKNIPITKSIAPIRNENGKISGSVVVFKDITHEYEVDRAKTEFVSLASHQLRTPLSAINWYAEMLINTTCKPPLQKKYLNEIYQSNQRMINLVNSLLNISRLEMGTFIIEPEECDILKIIDTIITELTPKLKEKKINFKKNYNLTIPSIKLDPKLIRIIFQNLLHNAIKYNKTGGEIELEINQKSNDLHIAVRDTGIGIPKQQQQNIFLKFFRADNVRQTETEGTGLGLYLVKSIVTKIGGKIWFKSKENKETIFFITIPLSGMKAKKGTKEIITVKM
jgi:signal transduction histidine kinase